MSTVPVQTLKQNLAEVLERVLHGDTVVITRRNRPIAEIHPIAPRGRYRGSRFASGDLEPLAFQVPASVLREVLSEDRTDDR